MKRLVDAQPRWLSSGQKSRHGMGLSFRCPHCDRRLAVWFENPIDNGPPIDTRARKLPLWKRTGVEFDSLTITPSIDARGRDPVTPEKIIIHWHGVILDGALLEVQ